LVRELVNSGIHFGHRISRWNPKMEPYIYGRRNLIHIIDIRETVKGLLRGKKFLSHVVANGGEVLFVGTKRQARHAIVGHAKRVGMPHVARRWLGGTLTNFRTIRSRLTRLEELEAAEADGRLQQYSKKAIAMHNRELRKIHNNLDGIREMDKLPAALVVVDVRREHLAVREAKKLGIPTVCLIDTDSDPDFATIPIPGNDDSMRSIETVVSHLTSAIEEGKRARTAPPRAEDADQPFRRRSRRPTSARAKVAADEKPAPTEEEPPAAPPAEDSTAEPDEQAASREPGEPTGEVPAMPETLP
jgi:small subunit ribosomal protein S2